MHPRLRPIFVAGISILFPLISMSGPVPANARTMAGDAIGQMTGPAKELTPQKKEAIVKRVAAEIRDRYVFADIGGKMAAYIEKRLAQGAYAPMTEIKTFCLQLTSDLREISKDKHLFVFQSPEEAKEVAAMNGGLPAEEIRKIDEAIEKKERRGNYGFRDVKILDGNIGYVDIDWVSGQPGACEKVVGLMRYLSDTEAIIVDLRDNGGGGGNAFPLLMSYFFEGQEVPFTGSYSRSTNQIKQSWSAGYVPGKRLPETAVYILVNSRTFSAAEDFGYSLQALKRAVIVGERTKGGAHPIDVIIIDGDILAQISIGNSVNPVTGTNWEDGGIKPDVEAKSEDAFRVAYRKALEHILEKTSDPEYKISLQEILAKQK